MDLTPKIRGAVAVTQHTKKDHNKSRRVTCAVQHSHTCWGDGLLYHTHTPDLIAGFKQPTNFLLRKPFGV
jgi:hypothetical protein